MTAEGSVTAQTRLTARGQSEVVGAVLVLGIMLIGAFAVLGLGAAAIGGTESGLTDQRAEKTMTQFDSKAGLVALGEANSQRISVPTEAGEQYRVDEDAGQLRVTVTNLSDESDSFEVMNETLGKVVYEHENETMAYQGGGVWRANDHGGSMVSPPEFHYRNGTLTLPAITVTGDSSLGSNVDIEHVAGEQQFPEFGTPGRLNPLDNHRVEVTVQSDYYRGWGQYFVTRTDGSVEYDHANETVTVTLVTPVNVNEITAASASLSAGGEFHVQGSPSSTCDEANNQVFTSSYDSSDGSYCDQWDDEEDRPSGLAGDVVYGKDIDISDGGSNSYFYGDITSGQSVTITDSSGEGQPKVYGNISFAEECVSHNDGDEVDCEQRIVEDSGGEAYEIDGVPLTESIDWFIDTSIEEIAANADQTDPEIDDEDLDAGTYYFDSFELDDEADLELNTSDGPVTIAVNKSVTIGERANISVTGENHVELYVGDRGDNSNSFEMSEDAVIWAKNNNATKFRTYGKADFTAELGDGNDNLAVFTGVIYAPPGRSGSGAVSIDGAEVFGGILSGETDLEDGSIHYDEALEGERVVPEDARIIRVTYLHVSKNTIEVTG